MNIRSLGSIIFTTLITLTLAACGGKTMVESDLGIEGAPDWVNEGTNILNDKGGRLFHGVGVAPLMSDFSLQKATADNRARAEIGRVLSSYMQVVTKDYISTSGRGDNKDEQQQISQEIENVTKVHLTGSRIIANWRHKKKGTIYALAELDMEHVKQTVRRLDTMNEGLRNYILSEGDNIFDRVEKGN